MTASIPETQIQAWRTDLTQVESQRRETTARAIAKAPTYDEQIIALLKEIARTDSVRSVRNAAKNALEQIAGAHFAAGNDIRAYLEQLRAGAYVPPIAPQAVAKPAAPPQPEAPPQSAPVPILVPEPKSLAPAEAGPSKPQSNALPEPQPSLAAVPRAAEATPRVEPAAELVSPPAPPVPFDQWLLSERNIKLALYSGGFLLLLAGLIFVGVNWAYLPGIVKLGVTLLVTLGMYAGGGVLFKRPSLKVGGVALLAIASGFLPLNFVVTHIYLTGERGISRETMWFLASLVCGAAYFFTTLRTRHNLFTVFTLIALLSGVTAVTDLARFDLMLSVLGYALVTLLLLLAAYRVRSIAGMDFMARPLRAAAHLLAPLVFVAALLAWFLSSNVASAMGNRWLVLVALLLLVVFYVIDDWRSHLPYARWSAALAFAIVSILLCTELRLSTIQTGLVLKVLALLYLLVGYYLQRGKKIGAGLPLYVFAALLAAFVTFLALQVYLKTPEHLALALMGDVALLSIAAYLFRRVAFVYGAAWLLVAPVFIYGTIYLETSVQRALALGVLMLIDAALGFRLAQAPLFRWALPFLSVAGFLGFLVPVMILPDYVVLVPVLLLIAALYGGIALRLRLPWLLLAAFVAVNLAILSVARLFYPLTIDLARIVAFAFCAWAVILFFARRTIRSLGLDAWAQPFAFGALANFVLTYLLMAFIAEADLASFGFVSQHLAFSITWTVALLALTAYLYRRPELVYVATWLLIASVYIFARLFLADPAPVGLVLGGLMLVYTAVGYFIGRERLKWGGAFLSAAALLSGIVLEVLLPDYPLMTATLLGIGILYLFVAVWLRWQWLSLAALAAWNLAVLTGALSIFTSNLEIRPASSIGYGAVGIVLLAAAVELKRRGLVRWKSPLYLVAALDLIAAFLLPLESSDLLAFIMSAVVALACFVMSWVEKDALRRLKVPAFLTYLGAFVTLVGAYYATSAFQLPTDYAPAVIALTGSIFVFAALGIHRADLVETYGLPLRHAGLFGIVSVMIAALLVNRPVPGALTYLLAAAAFGTDGFVRKQIALVYFGGASLVASIWWLLRFFDVTEWQAFAIPLGVLCLLVGWSEARRSRLLWFQLATLAGLLVLLGSAFYQSWSNLAYAVLLLVESALAFGIGVRLRSRLYVEAGILALLANGLAQFGPAFLQLSPWVHLGTVGSILLLAGLAALFRRQALLEARRSLTSQWKMWRP